MTQYKYHYRRYNEFDVVKVNVPTVVSVLFLSRHVLGLFIIGIALSRAQFDAKDAFSNLFEPIYMLADLPALLVLLAMFSRHPKSGPAIRLIWRCGRYLLLASASAYLILLTQQTGPDVMHYGWAVWLSIGSTAAAIAYVFLTPYVRDLFRQFPAPSDDAET